VLTKPSLARFLLAFATLAALLSPLSACDGGPAPALPDAASPPTADGGPPDAAAPALTLEEQLAAIPGLTFEEHDAQQLPGYRIFHLTYDQPVDHDHPEGQRFKQRMFLLHRDASAPMVLGTTGYSLYVRDRYLTEPTELLQANQLMVEERYFAASTPDPLDWSKLTIRQAAADHHRIAQAFKTIYKKAWIATGASKGGMTSIYHARFHPDDLAGVVAYVAPISFGAPDQRYLPFFETVGDASCRQAIRSFTRQLLVHRAALEARVPELTASRGSHFTQAGATGAIEGAAANFEFGFWQYGDASGCADIPGPTATDDDLWSFIANDVDGNSDETVAFFQAYYVQAYTELGFPASPTAHLADLLTGSEFSGLPSSGCCAPYTSTPMQEVASWVKTSGKHLLFIYGQNDPWSGGKFELGQASDSFEFTAPGANHGASIADLAGVDQQVALDAISRWGAASASMKRVTWRSKRPALREPWMRLPPRLP